MHTYVCTDIYILWANKFFVSFGVTTIILGLGNYLVCPPVNPMISHEYVKQFAPKSDQTETIINTHIG